MVAPLRPPGGRCITPTLAGTGDTASSEMLGTLEGVLEGPLEGLDVLVAVSMPDLAL